ncbi:MAG: hypothetical protein IMZ57_11185 [Acidobacteria bacterium]|nr:hypothetical protein [Acidobacteriota bacterium]
MLMEIGRFIVTKIPGLVLGGNFQFGFRPTTAPIRCSVIQEASPSPANFFLRDRVDYMLQIISRAADYETASADNWKFYNALGGTAGWEIPALVSGGQAYRAEVVEAIAIPQYIGMDGKNPEFSINFIFRMEKA